LDTEAIVELFKRAVGEGQVKISLHAAEKALWQRRLYGIRAAPAQGGYAVQAQDW